MPIAPKKVFLTKGQVAWVDAEDFDRVSQYKWHAVWIKHNRTWIARRGSRPQMLMSRFILGITDPNIPVDHKNHDTLNNQKYNLRVANHSQNSRNTRKHSNNKSGFKGVCLRGEKWCVQIAVDGKRIQKYGFKTAEEAYEVYKSIALEHHGEFACLE